MYILTFPLRYMYELRRLYNKIGQLFQFALGKTWLPQMPWEIFQRCY